VSSCPFGFKNGLCERESVSACSRSTGIVRGRKAGKYDRTKDKQVKVGQEWKGAAKTAGITETKL